MGRLSQSLMNIKPESLILKATEGSIEAPCITEEDRDFAVELAFERLGGRPGTKKHREIVDPMALRYHTSSYYNSTLESETGLSVTIVSNFWKGNEFFLNGVKIDLHTHKGKIYEICGTDTTARDGWDVKFEEIVKTVLDGILTTREEEYQAALEEQQKEIQSAQERFQAALKEFKLWTITRDNELICKLFQIETGKWTKDILHEDNLGFFSQEVMDNIVDNYEKLKG